MHLQSFPIKTFAILYAVYTVSLSCVYWYFISKVFAYQQFYRAFQVQHIVTASVISLALIFLMPRKKETSFYVSVFAMLLLFAPTTAYVTAGPGDLKFLLVTAGALGTVFIFSSMVNVPVPRVPEVSPKILNYGLLLLTIAYFLSVIMFGGLQFLNFDMREVYEIREAASSNLPGVFVYISPVVGKVAVPFLAVYGLAYRQYWLTAIGIGAGVFLFGLTAHKSPLFYGFVAAAIFFLAANPRRFVAVFVLGLIVVVAVSGYDLNALAEGGTAQGPFTGWIGSLAVRRAMMVPTLLNDMYLQFFEYNPKLWWSESRFTFGYLQSPYAYTMPHLIGAEMMGRPGMGANTGFIGSGFGNGGSIGVLVYAAMIGLFVSYLNSVSRGLGSRFVTAISFPALFTVLLSSDFVTALLTHGLVGLVLLLAMAFHGKERDTGRRVADRRRMSVDLQSSAS